MQVEDNLGLEAAKYNEIIKTRVKQLQDKIDDQRVKISCQQRSEELLKAEVKQSKKDAGETLNLLKSVQLDFKLANKDLKLKEEKLADMKREMTEIKKEN